MKFQKIKFFFNKTPLAIATEKGNIEIARLLLFLPETDVNIQSVFIIIYKISFL